MRDGIGTTSNKYKHAVTSVLLNHTNNQLKENANSSQRKEQEEDKNSPTKLQQSMQTEKTKKKEKS